MKTSIEIINELISTIEENSKNNTAEISNVKLWAQSWKDELSDNLEKELPLPFLIWYSGMSEDKIMKAYKRWEDEVKNKTK
jgi:hypothetical protein